MKWNFSTWIFWFSKDDSVQFRKKNNIVHPDINSLNYDTEQNMRHLRQNIICNPKYIITVTSFTIWLS